MQRGRGPFRPGGAASKTLHARQVLSTTRAAEQAAAAAAAEAARKSAVLQRSRATYEVQLRMADDDDMPPMPFDDDYEDGLLHGLAGPQQQQQQRQQQQQPSAASHGDRKVAFEQRFRQHIELGLKYRTMFAAPLADYLRQDLQQRIDTVQQRVDEMAREMLVRAHPGCPSPDLRLVMWRPLFLRCWYGTGLIHVPTFRCGTCKEFEMHPAAVNCHASTPQAARIWYDGWVCRSAHLLEVEGGVAAHTLASVLDQLADGAEQQQAEPRQTLPTVPKVFTPAMRHARVELHLNASPATHGADIFSTVVGECAPCAGHVLRMRQQEAGAAVEAEGAAGQAGAVGDGSGGVQAACEAVGEQPNVLGAASGGEQAGRAAPELLPGASCSGAVAAAQQDADGELEEEPLDAGMEALLRAAEAEQVPLATEASGPQRPVCKLLPKVVIDLENGDWVLKLGIIAVQRLLAANFDACVKLGHYKACGATTTEAYRRAGLGAAVQIYFGSAGALAAALRPPAAGAAAANSAAGGLEAPACDAHLSCAREAARRGSGTLEEQNVCGGVCCHGVPIKQLFLSSPHHEHFGQYVGLLGVALSDVLPELQEVLLDINCQFSRHIAKNHSEWAGHLGYHVGWLHAKAGHNLECQLAFNAMFAPGLGRCFGEQIEQLWSELKPVTRKQRYEALQHRLLTLELALHHVGMSKYGRAWQLLVQTLRHTQRRLAKLLAELEAALEQAREAGFDIDASAAFELPQQEAEKLTLQQIYVQKLATKSIYDSLTSRGGNAVIAGLDTATGRALAVQVNDPKHREKIESEVADLRPRVGLAAGVDWVPDDAQYQEAAIGLRAAMLRQTEVRLERHVSYLNTLQEDRGSELQSGHATGLIRARIRYRIRQIRELMAVWEAWQRFNQERNFEPPAWEETDVFNNVLPWTAASSAQGLTEQHLRYKVYCISQEIERCHEELRFLPQDALNAMQYYQHQQRVLVAAVGAVRAAEQQAQAPSEVAMSQGRAYALQAWQARIAGMQQQAAAAFQEVGWM